MYQLQVECWASKTASSLTAPGNGHALMPAHVWLPAAAIVQLIVAVLYVSPGAQNCQVARSSGLSSPPGRGAEKALTQESSQSKPPLCFAVACAGSVGGSRCGARPCTQSRPPPPQELLQLPAQFLGMCQPKSCASPSRPGQYLCSGLARRSMRTNPALCSTAGSC